jgi:SAM-dependent methyltransferase
LDLRKIAPSLELTNEGWWTSRTLSDVAYPEDGNSLCFAIEDSSFWFQHRNRCILEALRLFPPPGALFDVGGGNGYVALAIEKSGLQVVLVEPGPAGVRNALKRGVTSVVHATLDDLGALPETLPAVGLFDVIEHIEDDSGFIEKVNRFLEPGGRAYITVPAYGLLWSHEDVHAGHSRRYTTHSLSKLLKDAGYSLDFVTYFFSFLPLPIFFRRVLPYRLGFARTKISPATIRSDHQLRSALLGRVLDHLSQRELSKIAEGAPLRQGASCLAVARKAK